MRCYLCRSVCTLCTSYICENCLSRLCSLYSPRLIDISHLYNLDYSLKIYAMFPYESVIRDLIRRVKVDVKPYALECLLFLWSYFLHADKSIMIGSETSTLAMPYSLFSRFRLKYPLTYLMRNIVDQTFATKPISEYRRAGFVLGKRSLKGSVNYDIFNAFKIRKQYECDLIIVDDVVTTGYSYARLSNVYRANNVLGLCFAYSPSLNFRNKRDD